ncbi:MAG: isoprenoid biosynthesis glyoxalase ElbB [Candidatus Marinimicrobia bacterium]|nr:isoprenoid biosynthesis glyoxalase ElbB [Candidatus Neomarinimicrobiota bacterium]
MPKVGIVISGCGVYDGAEIHETVITMLSLDRAGAEIVMMAPDIGQLHVINHLSGEEMPMENRNVLVEAARIARGNIRDLSIVSGSGLDALIFPGGFGAAKNLSDYSMVGADCEVNPDVVRLVTEMVDAGKPIGVICIAPVILTKIMELMGRSVKLTIGSDANTARDIQVMGGQHIVCPVDEFVVDEKNKIVSTPAYMLGPQIKDVAVGIEKLVNKILTMI